MEPNPRCRNGCCGFPPADSSHAMQWVIILILAPVLLGLRDRTSGGSTTMTLLVIIVTTLGVVLVGLGKV